MGGIAKILVAVSSQRGRVPRREWPSFVPLPNDIRSAIHSHRPRDGTAPPAPPDSSRKPAPQRASHWVYPLLARPRCNCVSPLAESVAAPAKRAIETPFRADPVPRVVRDFQTSPNLRAPFVMLPPPVPKAKNRAAVRQQGTPHGDSPRPPPLSLPATASKARARSHPQSPDQKVNVRSTIRSFSLATLGKTRRRHPQLRSLVCPARRSKPRLIDRIRHAAIPPQRIAQSPRTQRSLILKRTHAHLLLERALHRERTHPRHARQFGERYCAIKVRLKDKLESEPEESRRGALGRHRLQARNPAA